MKDQKDCAECPQIRPGEPRCRYCLTDLIGELSDKLHRTEAALEEAVLAIEQADKHCEAIALSSLCPPLEMFGDGDDDFYKQQATKSVGSGGRAHHILKEFLKKWGGE